MSEHDSTGHTRTFTVAALTVIMVLSVFALGFTGSAAAVSETDNGEVLIASNPADSQISSASHTVTIQVGSQLDGRVFGTQRSQINISYGSGNDVVSSVGGVNDVEIIRDNSRESLGGSINTGGSGSFLEINSISGGSGADPLESGDLIRITFTGNPNGFDNSNIDKSQVEIRVADDKAGSDILNNPTAEYTDATTSEISLPLDRAAGIKLTDQNRNFTSLSVAVNHASSPDSIEFTNTVTSSDDTRFNELKTQNNTAADNLATIATASGTADVDIGTAQDPAEDSFTRPVIVSDAGGGSPVFDGGTENAFTLENVTVDGSTVLGDANRALNVSNDNPTKIRNVRFTDSFSTSGALINANNNLDTNFDVNNSEAVNDQAIDIPGTASGGASIELRQNVFDAGDNDAVSITVNDNVEIDAVNESYTIDDASPNAGLALTATGAQPTSADNDGVNIDSLNVSATTGGSSVTSGVALAGFDGGTAKVNISADTEVSNFSDVEQAVNLTDLDSGTGASTQEINVSDVTIAGDDESSNPAIDLRNATAGSNSLTVNLRVDDTTFKNLGGDAIDVGSSFTSGDPLNGGQLTLELNNNGGSSITFDNIDGSAIRSQTGGALGSGTTVDIPDAYGSDLKFNGVGSAVNLGDSAGGAFTVSNDELNVSSDVTLQGTTNDAALVIETSQITDLNISDVTIDGSGDGVGLNVSDSNTDLQLDYSSLDASNPDFSNLDTAIDVDNAAGIDNGDTDTVVSDIAFEDVSDRVLAIDTNILNLNPENIDVNGDSGTALDIENDNTNVTIDTDDVYLGDPTQPGTDSVTSGIDFTASNPSNLTIGGELRVGISGTSGTSGTAINYDGSGTGDKFYLNNSVDIEGELGGSTTTAITVDTDDLFFIDDGVDEGFNNYGSNDNAIEGVDNGLDIQGVGSFDATSFDSRELEDLQFKGMGSGTAINIQASDIFSGVSGLNNEKALVLLNTSVEAATGESPTGVKFDDGSSGLVIVDGDLGNENNELGTGVQVDGVDSEANVTAGTSINASNNGIVANADTILSDQIPVTVSNEDRFAVGTAPTITGTEESTSTGITASGAQFDFNGLESTSAGLINKYANGIKFDSSGTVAGDTLADVRFKNIGGGAAIDVDDYGGGATLVVTDATIESNGTADTPTTGIAFDDGDKSLTVESADIGSGSGNAVDTGVSFTAGGETLELNADNTITLTSNAGAGVDVQAASDVDFVDEGDDDTTPFSLDVSGSGAGDGVNLAAGSVNFIGSDQFRGNFTIDNTNIGVDIQGGSLDNANELNRLDLTQIQSTGLNIQATTGNNPTYINGTEITLDDSAATGIDHGVSTNLVVTNATIESADGSQLGGTSTGIDIGNDNAAVDIDEDDAPESLISNVSTGLNVDDADELNLSDNPATGTTEFNDIGATAVNITDTDEGIQGNVTVNQVDVNNSAGALGLQYTGQGDKFTVQNTDLNSVESGINLDNIGATTTDKFVVTDVTIDGETDGFGIGVDSGALDGDDEDINIDGDVTVTSVNAGLVFNSGGIDETIGSDSENVDITAESVGIDIDTDVGGSNVTIQAGVNATDGGVDPNAIQLAETGDSTVEVTSSELGTAGEDQEVFQGVSVTSSATVDTLNVTDSNIDLNQSISATGVNSGDGSTVDTLFKVENVDIETENADTGNGLGISADTNGAEVALFGQNSSTITDTGQGVRLLSADKVDDLASDNRTISGATFDGLTGSAINVSDPGLDDTENLSVSNLAIENGESTTVVEFEETSTQAATGTNLSVTDISGIASGSGTSDGVREFVRVQDAYANVTVNNGGADSTLTLTDPAGSLTAGDGIIVENVDAGDDSDGVKISGITTIEGDGSTDVAQNSKALVFNYDAGQLSLSDLSTIKDVNTALDANEHGTEGTLDLSGITIENYHDDGIILTDDDLSDVAIDDASITSSDTASDSAAVTLESSSVDIDLNHTTFNGESGESDTALNLVSIDDTGTHEIHYNDLENYEVGITGAVTNLSREEAIANYYGSSGGPNADDGANVSIDDSDLRTNETAAIYDPYLTADVATVENEVGTSNNLRIGDGIQSFGQDLTIQQDGQSFAVPTQIEDLETAAVQEPSSGYAIYEYNTTAGEYQVVDESTEESNFEAYAVALEDQSESLTLNLDYNNTVNRPGSITYEQGFNLVPVTSATSGVSNPTDAATFDLAANDNGNPTDTVELLGDDPAAGSIYQHDTFANVDADNIGQEAPFVSPYNGVWVFVESGSATIDETNIGPTGPAVTIDDVVNNGNLENAGNDP